VEKILTKSINKDTQSFLPFRSLHFFFAKSIEKSMYFNNGKISPRTHTCSMTRVRSEKTPNYPPTVAPVKEYKYLNIGHRQSVCADCLAIRNENELTLAPPSSSLVSVALGSSIVPFQAPIMRIRGDISWF
jgi:hypothetical protein